MIDDTAGSVMVATTPNPIVAVLERVGQLTHVWPPLKALTQTLRTTALLPDPRRGGRLIRVAKPLFRRIDDPHYGPGLVVPAGLEAVVRRLFGREGYAVRETGERPAALPAPDLDGAARIGPVDRVVLDLVHQRDRGVIAFDGERVDPSHLVAQIVLAYPELTFAIVASRRREVSRLAARLRRHVPDVSWATGSSPLGKIGRVLVSTPLELGATPIEIGNRQFVIHMDVVEAVGVNAQFALRHASRARLFALRDRSRDLAPYERFQVAALFGFDEVVIPGHGEHLRPVEVDFRRIVGGPVLDEALNVVALKRAAIWRHGLRNRWIARLARDLAAGDGRALRALKAPTAERLQGAGEMSVVVLVENLEHALDLVARLPGWPIVAAADIAAAGLRAEQAELLARSRWEGPGAPARAIATALGLESIGVAPWDVVVRADGGTGAPPILELLITGNQNRGPLLLLDFDDRHHPELLRRSRGRRDDYRLRGWSVDGRQAPTPVERFLAARTGRAR